MNVDDAQTMNGKIIGIIDDENNLQLLRNYIDINGWNMAIKEFTTYNELLKSLHRNEIQAVVDNGTHITTSERRIVSFAVVPEQLMTTKENIDLCNEFTKYIQTIEIMNPSFETSLKDEYVNPAVRHIMRYTEDELNFIDSSPILKVVFLPPVPTMYDVTKRAANVKGIYLDLLEIIKEDNDLDFELIQANSMEDLREMLISGTADMTVAIYTNTENSQGLSFSSDFRREKFSAIVYQGDKKHSVQNTIAVPKIFFGIEGFFHQKFNEKILLCDNIEECLEAIERGKCDIAYVPESYLQSENTLTFYQDLAVQEEINVYVPISMAISPKDPPILQKIISRAFLKLRQDQVEKVVQKNSAPNISFRYLMTQYPLTFAGVLCLLLIGAGAAVFVNFRNRMTEQKNAELSAKNEELLHALQSVENMRISRDSYKSESETDKLTRLYNKAAMMRLCQEKLEEPDDGKITAFYIIDLDHFKEANDTYGHQHGDKILQEFAAKLKKIFRSNDYVARFGGDEFTVFISGLPNQDVVERKAVQILEAASTIYIDGELAKITSSVGIALVPRDGKDYDSLFKAADKALYQVKLNGRNGYCIDPPKVVHLSDVEGEL